MLACDRSCCYSLSHFLPFTYLLAFCRVRSVSPFILFSTLLHSHRNANPTQELAVILSLRSISLFSLSGSMSFPPCISTWLQPGSVSLHLASPPHTYTPYRLFAPIHSIRSFLPALAFPNAQRSSKKNAPNWLPAAPCHRAPRFLCPGYSLNSHRLARNAQAEYFVPFLSTCISALLSTLAQGCFSFSV